MQLKLNVYISRSDNETIIICPFKPCSIDVESSIWVSCLLPSILIPLTIYLLWLMFEFVMSLNISAALIITIALCCGLLLAGASIMIGILIYRTIQKFRNKRYIARLKESSKI